ncbi:hypothetical protein [Streptomyces sp. NBC_01264]|uniref:hypothetical protein n=1 Tax=Streptomyces sp. NBC_01264 TaxID=2903804 RepID=UPI00225B4D5F|nr:hypothetical protein [Streptomyces sp. NBC_01264]MCX4780919.1 hypothetical protein [Streptomyces sp. NBC_01264]
MPRRDEPSPEQARPNESTHPRQRYDRQVAPADHLIGGTSPATNPSTTGGNTSRRPRVTAS